MDVSLCSVGVCFVTDTVNVLLHFDAVLPNLSGELAGEEVHSCLLEPVVVMNVSLLEVDRESAV